MAAQENELIVAVDDIVRGLTDTLALVRRADGQGGGDPQAELERKLDALVRSLGAAHHLRHSFELRGLQVPKELVDYLDKESNPELLTKVLIERTSAIAASHAQRADGLDALRKELTGDGAK